jgi:hypothetical protein
MTAKEVGALIGRSQKWVSAQCARNKFPTLPPHRRPYLIPRTALFPGSELKAKETGR